MKFLKKKPLRKKSNLDLIKKQGCKVCGKRNVDAHHIVSRGAGGGDELSNLIALCREHHTEIHTIGKETFGDKYGLDI
jgi:5-methylcytosine-specific restriction endonuclease McrA